MGWEFSCVKVLFSVEDDSSSGKKLLSGKGATHWKGSF